MIYVGIDVSKSKHDCCILDSEHKDDYEEFTIPNTRNGYDHLLKRIFSYNQSVKNIKAGLEATGEYSVNITRFLLNNGLATCVLNPLLTDQYRKSHSLRKTKTDRIDAHFIACILMSDLDLKPYVPQEYHNKVLKSLTRTRFGWVHERSLKKQTLTRIIDTSFSELPQYINLDSATAHALLKEYPTPEKMANANLKHMKEIIYKTSKGRLSMDLAEQIRNAARHSVGLGKSDISTEINVVETIHDIEVKNEQIQKVESRIKKLLEERKEPLLTIPGISIATGSAILGEIGDFSRFSSPDKILAYAGFAPSKNQSGRRSGIGPSAHMEKRGSRYLRHALFNAARFVCQNEPAYKEYLAKKLSEGKHFYIAISHVVKKLVRLIYALQTRGIPYKTPAQLMLQRQINTGSDSQDFALDI
ncbi:MAG: IS110 family transposase [Acidaminococcus sp.]|jgi:transposase|nr:IS110 family transposase [Acidaminococcus sp.]MCH3950389.1 IS110 family transposase [Acidaminococcus sp.]MCH3950690.1 IS110 family transposase [Acidaminococcus sp.]MCH3950809.1 IS110 family transposase [Acidaminococcus sp.]MCH3950827.1 IS110 family transposase [Acidaminococcus sp.]